MISRRTGSPGGHQAAPLARYWECRSSGYARRPPMQVYVPKPACLGRDPVFVLDLAAAPCFVGVTAVGAPPAAVRDASGFLDIDVAMWRTLGPDCFRLAVRIAVGVGVGVGADELASFQAEVRGGPRWLTGIGSSLVLGRVSAVRGHTATTDADNRRLSRRVQR